MALVGEAIVAGGTSVLLKNLQSKNFREKLFTYKIDDSLYKKLTASINTVEILLSQAANYIDKSDHIKKWVKAAMRELYEAEDNLEWVQAQFPQQYEVKHAALKHMYQYKRVQIARGVHPTKKSLEQKLEEVTISLTKTAVGGQATHELATNEAMVKYRAEANRVTDYNKENCSGFHARSEEEEKIKSWLNLQEGADNALRIIPIVGMGGIGKSRLASMLFKNYEEMDTDAFTVKCWVHVSDVFEEENFLHKILMSLPAKTSVEPLRQTLREQLKIQKFLIVLDDVWGHAIENNWEALVKQFSVGAKGSRIIITTRDEEVARATCTNREYIHHLEVLSDGDCWSMLEKEDAFQSEDEEIRNALADTGKSLAKKCKGLPLAARELETHLKKSREFDNAGQSKIVCVQNFKTENVEKKVIRSLWQSYHHLSYSVKMCFAYIATFPKSYKFSKKTLVVLWMAEGFVEKDGEQLAEKYFDTLVDKSLVQLQSVIGSTKWFSVHDYIHDLALSESMGFQVNLDEVTTDSLRHLHLETRRLAYIRNKNEKLVTLENVGKLQHLRTVLPLTLTTEPQFGITFADSKAVLSKFKYLRVLSLKCYDITELPSSVGAMTILKYLDLSYTKLECLPEYICKLYNLQTLLLCDCTELRRLPRNIRNLGNLRHLSVEGNSFINPDLYGFEKNLEVSDGEFWKIKLYTTKD